MRAEDSRIHAPELEGGRTWFNSDGPLCLKDLRGQVVVLDFWTYGCINCIHMQAVLGHLERRFADEPVVVIGVHAAKFTGEDDEQQVGLAIERHRVRHPVVMDTQMRIWSSYAVKAWPTLVVVRPDGSIAATHQGEIAAEELIDVVARELEQARAQGLVAQRPHRVSGAEPVSTGALAYPGKVIADAAGSLWIADSGHHRVIGADRSGVVHAVIGSGIGSGQPGYQDGGWEEAVFDDPQGMVLSPDGEELYVADARSHTVRRVDIAARTVTTIAGTGRCGRALHRPGTPLPAMDTDLRSPWDLALDPEAGALYIAMAGSHQIWRMDLASGTLHVLAGTSAEAMTDGPFAEATFAQPSGLALSPDRKRLYVADSEASAVRVLHLQGGTVVGTLVGHGLFDFGDVDGPGHEARLQRCMGIALSPAGVVVADTYNHKLRGINPRHNRVMTLWQGQGATRLNQPGGVTFDREDRSYVVADTNHHRLLRVARDASSAVAIELTGLEP